MPARSPLSEIWKVPPVFRRRLRESIGRQRAMSAEGHLLLVLHAPPTAKQPQRTARFFWRSADGVWQSAVGPGIAALQKHIAEFDDILKKLDEAREQAERAEDFFPLLRAIAPLRRTARNLYDTLQEAREMTPDDSDLIVCRDPRYLRPEVHEAGARIERLRIPTKEGRPR